MYILKVLVKLFVIVAVLNSSFVQVLAQSGSINPPIQAGDNQATKSGLKNYAVLTADFGLNAGVSVGSELSNTFNFGNGIKLGMSYNAWSDQLFVGPKIHFEYLFNYYNPTTQDNLMWWGAGVEAEYFIRKRGTTAFNFYPSITAMYSGANDFLSPRQGFTGGSVNLLTARGVLFGGGAGILFRNIFLEGAYYYYRPNITLDDQLLADLNSTQGLYEVYEINNNDNLRMNFDYFNITLGIMIEIK